MVYRPDRDLTGSHVEIYVFVRLVRIPLGRVHELSYGDVVLGTWTLVCSDGSPGPFDGVEFEGDAGLLLSEDEYHTSHDDQKLLNFNSQSLIPQNGTAVA